MEFQHEFLLKIFASVFLAGLLWLFWYLYSLMINKPENLRSILRKQGINGPSPVLLLGNILEMKKKMPRSANAVDLPDGPPTHHNCGEAIFPFLESWRKDYGELFMFSTGSTVILHVTQPDMVREITTCTNLDLGKPLYQARNLGPLLGDGILTSNGQDWIYRRKILAPQLFMEKVKGMVSLIQESAMAMVNLWNNIIENEGGIADIEIDQHMRRFSGDVISKACFGSNYTKGAEIFSKLRALQQALSKNKFAMTMLGMRYLPIKSNREAWALEKEVKKLIMKVVQERKEGECEKDLLQVLLEATRNSELSQSALNSFIVDNCKNIYLAGFETTAVSATWCLMLLAANPEWQERVRAEVSEICKTRIPDADMVQKMKLLGMVINESLRLYPPVAIISREALKDLKIQDIHIPKGVSVWTLALTLHTDPEIWGEDAYKFNPERFANGVNGACKLPYLYMPFGVGPRVCLGQNLAILEMKILISLLLCSFSFSISPNYVHSPALHLVIEPKLGANLIVKKKL